MTDYDHDMRSLPVNRHGDEASRKSYGKRKRGADATGPRIFERNLHNLDVTDPIKAAMKDALFEIGPQATSQAPGILPGRRSLVAYDGRGFPKFLAPEGASYPGWGKDAFPWVASRQSVLDSLMRKSAQAAVAAGVRLGTHQDRLRRRVEHQRRRALEIDPEMLMLREEYSARRRQKAIGLSVVWPEPATRRFKAYIVAKRELEDYENFLLAKEIITVAQEILRMDDTRAGKRRRIEQAHCREPWLTDREIARRIGVSPTTVGAVRAKLDT